MAASFRRTLWVVIVFVAGLTALAGLSSPGVNAQTGGTGSPTLGFSFGAPSATPNQDLSLIFADDYSAACNLPKYRDDLVAYNCEGGEYTMQNLAPNKSWRVSYGDVYTDTVVELDARVISGPPLVEYGLVFRQAGDKNAYYLFSITTAGTYGLFRYAAPNYTTLAADFAFSTIKKGKASNHFKVVAEKNQIALYINDQWLKTVTDATLASGGVGLFISSDDPGAKVGFDNLKIYGINRPLTLPQGAPFPTPTDPNVLWQVNFGKGCTPDEDQYSLRQCEGGEFTVSKKTGPGARWFFYYDNYADAVFEMDTHYVSGPPDTRFGLLFRVDPQGNNFYTLMVTRDGQYAVFRYDGKQFLTLVPYTVSPAVGRDTAANHLKVVAQGTRFTAYVNDQLLTTFTDAALGQGSLGMILDSDQPNAKVAFNNLRVSRLPAGTTTTTGTPAPSATPRATTTVTATSQFSLDFLFNPPTTGTPPSTGDTSVVFTDDFSTDCNLPKSNTEDLTRKCEGGEYTILIKSPNIAIRASYATEYGDAVLEADARAVVDSGNMAYGLLLHESSDYDHYYVFGVKPDGRYFLLRYDRPNWTTVVPNTASSAIKKGTATNRLKAILQDTQLALYVNDQWLTTVDGITLTQGHLGLYADSEKPGAKAAFDNLRISKINRPLTLPPGGPAPGPTATPTGAANADTTVVLRDDFTPPCELYEGQSGNSTYACAAGEYQITTQSDPNGSRAAWVFYGDMPDDVVVEADAHKVSGPDATEYGVIFRVTNDADDFYGFTIMGNQYSLFYHTAGGNYADLIPWTRFNAIKTGTAFNHLKVIAQGNQIALYINDQWLTTLTDKSSTQGTVGFFAGVSKGTGKVGFDNLSVSRINRPLKLPTP